MSVYVDPCWEIYSLKNCVIDMILEVVFSDHIRPHVRSTNSYNRTKIITLKQEGYLNFKEK